MALKKQKPQGQDRFQKAYVVVNSENNSPYYGFVGKNFNGKICVFETLEQAEYEVKHGNFNGAKVEIVLCAIAYNY